MTAVQDSPTTPTAHVEGIRTRTISWADPARARFRGRSLDGYERMLAIKRGEIAPPPSAALLGLTLESVGRGSTTFSLLADESHENPMGTMHGGIIATLVDTAMGCAVSTMLPADGGFTTLELKTNYVRAITEASGRVFAVGTVVHIGGRIATTEARVIDADGTLYAHATSTCMVTRSHVGSAR